MGRIFGEFIRGAREVSGLSQAQVASQLGLKSPQFISNIERGIAPLPRTQVAALSKILKISKDDILDALVEDIRHSYMNAIQEEGVPTANSASAPLKKLKTAKDST